MNEFKLCYVEKPWAYFTTQELSKQWGNDWDDAPYEHNASPPYFHREGDDYKIIKVAFDSCLITPDVGHYNSPWSVEQINDGQVAWLRSDRWFEGQISIHAGASLDEFMDKIKLAKGSVYTNDNTPME